MFVAMNRLTAPAEFGARVEQGFAHSNMAGVAGLINFKLLKLDNKGEGDLSQVLYIAMTTWEDRLSFETWRDSDNFARAHGGQGGNSPLQSALENFEVVLDR